MAPLALNVEGACKALGLGRTKLYELINQGELRAVKSNGRTLILESDLRAWLQSLPAVKPGKSELATSRGRRAA